jgi:VWFA-related protein
MVAQCRSAKVSGINPERAAVPRLTADGRRIRVRLPSYSYPLTLFAPPARAVFCGRITSFYLGIANVLAARESHTAMNLVRRLTYSLLSVCVAAPFLVAQDVPTLHTSSSAPQERQQDTPSFHSEVKEVLVPVTIRDKHGKIVQTLDPKDFTLVQDGKTQTITSFRRDTNLPLTLGLLVDTSMSMHEQLGAEKSASQKFLDEMLTQAKDQAFVIHFDREVELLQDVTASKDKLYNALGMLESAHTDVDTTRGNGGDGDEGQRGSRHHGGTQLYDAVYLAANEILSKQQGRKAIVILTDGRDRGSKETLSDAVEAAQRADTTVYAIYFKGEEEHRGFGDRRGGGMGGPRIGYPGGKILTDIATKTGGQMFEAKKKDNIDAIYAQIEEELRSQYMLAYKPDAASEGYHRITVTAKDKDLKVQAREGFYVGEETTAAK